MEQRPRFANLLAEYHLRPHFKKKLLGGQYVNVGPLLSVGGFLFEEGAILGRAFRSKLEIFAFPYCGQEPGDQELAKYIREEGRNVRKLAHEAKTLHELFMMHEMEVVSSSLPRHEWGKWFVDHAAEKVSIESVAEMSQMHSIYGAGFGSEFPELTEALYVKTYRERDEAGWRRAREAGLDIPAEQAELVPLEEREREAVTGFTEFCQDFFPELLDSLDL